MPPSSKITGEVDVESALDEVVELLRSRGHRVTMARRLLIRILLEASDHRTAEELAIEVHGLAPDVSISTIYRNLEELERLGVIEHAHLGHGAATYHLAASAHGHLVCSNCDKTIEVSPALFDGLAKRAKQLHGFTIDPHHLAMVGMCQECEGSDNSSAGRGRSSGPI